MKNCSLLWTDNVRRQYPRIFSRKWRLLRFDQSYASKNIWLIILDISDLSHKLCLFAFILAVWTWKTPYWWQHYRNPCSVSDWLLLIFKFSHALNNHSYFCPKSQPYSHTDKTDLHSFCRHVQKNRYHCRRIVTVHDKSHLFKPLSKVPVM